MKKFIYTLLLPLLLLACSKEHVNLPVEQAGLRFDIDASDFVQNRMGDDSQINSLELWVFDEDGLFLERKVATLVSQTSFTAQLTEAASQRRIHFIANYSLADESEWYGRDEREMLPLHTTSGDPASMAMWSRIVVDEIRNNQDLGLITLLRNMAKFSLSISTDKLTDVSYSLFNTYDKGTLAPFNPTTGIFEEGKPTEPAGAIYQNNKPFVAPGNLIYGFERENATQGQHANIACLIIKARYNGGAESYYKIDFVHADDKTIRYDILRNHFFNVTINDVFTDGQPTIAAALAGVAANNVSLSEEVQMFPSFSDGNSRIEVAATDLIYVSAEPSGTVQAKYFPDINSDATDNSKLRIDNTSGNAVSSATINAQGLITLNLNAQPAVGAGRLRSTVIVGVEGKPDLKRIIKVEVGRHYKYKTFAVNGVAAANNALTVDVPNAQGSEMNIVFSLPEEFRPAFFPLSFRIYTENFYPSNGSQNMILGIEAGKVYYTYTVNSMPVPVDGPITLNFKSNKASVGETVRVKCKFFDDQVITVQ